VEHTINLKRWLFGPIFWGFLMLLATAGCKKPHPNPEQLDPIYGDFIKEVAQADKSIKEEEDQIKSVEAKLAALQPRDILRGSLSRELSGRKKRLVGLQERRLYFETRAEKRKAHAQREYLAAFEKDEPWPDPEEFSAYLAVKKLQSASRNWDDRVPRLKNSRSAPPEAEKEPQNE
jgi:hypothetical protein